MANHGVWSAWWEDGSRRSECSWRRGVVDGPCRAWERTGELHFEGRYRSAAADPPWSYWRSNGVLRGRAIFASGGSAQRIEQPPASPASP